LQALARSAYSEGIEDPTLNSRALPKYGTKGGK